MYVDNFMNKPIEVEYCVDKIVESKLKLKFLKPFEKSQPSEFFWYE